MTITKTREFEAGVDVVWEVLTDFSREQRYWTNIREVRVLSRKEGEVEREATVGPRGFAQKSRQTITLEPKSAVRLALKGEAIEGERTVTLTPAGDNRTSVRVEWKLKLEGVPGFVNGIVRNQISAVTDEALTKMARDAQAGGRER